MKTRLLLSSAVAMLCMYANADNSLKVVLKSQESITYALAEQPVYWTSTNTLFVKSSSLLQEFDLDDVEKISFDGISSDVKTIDSDNAAAVYPTIASDAVFVSAPSASEVHVYNDGGEMVSKMQTAGSEEAKIDISSWTSGLYIIEVNAKTFKIIKK